MTIKADIPPAPLPPSAIVCGLFDDLVTALVDAGRAIRERRIEDRFKALRTAFDIVADLSLGLEDSATDEWTLRTAELYRYLNRLFLIANLHDDPKAVADSLALIEPVRHAWRCMAEEEGRRLDAEPMVVSTDALASRSWGDSAAAD